TQTANAYGVFLLLLAGAVALIWACSAGRLSGPGMALAATLLMALDVTTFAPYHDTIAADPVTARFTVRKYATGLLDAPWKITDQDALLAALRRLPPGVRVDNTAEVLPDNYSQVDRIPFATGYNVLDIAERFQMLTEWPNLGDTTRRDLLNVGYVLTLPDAADAPEPGAKLLLKNSQGQLWERAQQPSYAQFSTSLRPAATAITLNGLLSRPGVAPDAQPSVAAEGAQLHTILRQLWPEAVDKPLYAIGTTGVQSPVDIGVLAGGPIQYSAVIVDGVTVTPRQRGIVLALIDPASGKLIAANGFDTYASSDESARMAALISSAADGTIIALATYDEGTVSLGDVGRAAIASLGAKVDLKGQTGAAYALVGVKGAAAGSALEQIGKTAVTLDVGVGALPTQPEARFTSSLLSYQPDQISLLVQNNVRGLLTVSESVYPGWDAWVDGLPTTTLRVNGLLRGVILPPALDGHPHEVTFIYRPMSARLGGALALFSLSLSAGVLLALAVSALPRPAWRRRRRPQPVLLLGHEPTTGGES
ncbi:MAG: interleukin-like EMT inducer domain-containing protein, partial [Chloroflexales bacterium]